jgi:hypothetical protein
MDPAACCEEGVAALSAQSGNGSGALWRALSFALVPRFN